MVAAANAGTTTRFLRARALQPANIQLGISGIDPPAQVPQRDFIDVTPAVFGTGCIVNEQVILNDQDGVLAWLGDRLAVSMFQGEDLILRDYLVSAASPINAAGGSNGDNPTNLGISDFSMVATTLDTNNAYKFINGIDASRNISTTPIRACYVMLSSTELQGDFDAMVGSGFNSSWNYSNNQPAFASEYGNVFNIRILTSSQAAVARGASANSQDVYYNTVLGKQAVTHLSQEGGNMRLMYRGPEFSGMMQQNCTLAVKFWQGQGVTQDTGIRNLLSTRLTTLGV